MTETFELAGMTFTYERGADEASIDDQFLRVYDPGQLPGWAQPVELEQGASAKVWVGQDPSTGDVSMFVESPERWGGTPDRPRLTRHLRRADDPARPDREAQLSGP